MRRKKWLFAPLLCYLFTSCTENYSNGERIGLITQFSKTGVFWKSYEGHLNLTQTGMNSSSAAPFNFSLDRDNYDEQLKNEIDSAATYGWKVKLTYHETFGKNWFENRGETNHFITKVEVLDKNLVKSIDSRNSAPIHDTIYLVIFKDKDAHK